MKNLLFSSRVGACIPKGMCVSQRLITLWVMCVCVLMQSCEREPSIRPQEPSENASPRIEEESIQGAITRYVTRAEVPHVIAKLKPYFQKYQTRQEEPILYIDSIHMDRLKVVSATDTTYSDLPLSVYSMFVGSDIPNTLFNIYIEEYPDSTLSAPYVLMYHMDSTFASAYFAGEKGMDSFVGTLSKHEMDVMFGSYLNGQRTIDLEIIIYCLKKVFGDPDGPGGAPGNSPGVGAFPTGTLASSIPTGGIYWVPDDDGTPCTWHIGAATGTLYIDCTGGKPIPRTLWNGSESDTEARTEYTFEECLRILIMCGIIDERPGIEDGGTTPPEPEPTFGEFLAEQLGFVPGTQDFTDISICIDNSSKQTRMTIAQLLEPGVLTDPCNPENSAEEMLHDAAAEGCGNGGGLSEEDILTGLGTNNPYIIQDYSFQHNSKMNCIWSKLNTQDELYCETLGSFFDSPLYNLILAVGPQQACARTYSNYDGYNSVGIVFDPGCITERSELELVKTILHESIHAEIYRIIHAIEEYQDLSPDDYPELWEAYRTENDWQHEYMANLYLDQLAMALGEFDQWKSSYAHYIALAWQGLDVDQNGHPITDVWNDLSISEKQTIRNLRNELLEDAELNCE